MTPVARRRIQAIARVCLVLWVGPWLLFAILSRLGEGASIEGMATLATRGGTLIALALIAWRAPMIGGWLLLTVGLLLLNGVFRFSQNPNVIVRLILGGPPLFIGVLFVAAAWKKHEKHE